MDFFKIGSGEITNYPLLKKISSKGLPIVLSTGMSNLTEIDSALKVLVNNGIYKKKITLLHANTEYPTPYSDVNLMAIKTLSKKFNVSVGYSDHTTGIEIPIAAVAIGAKIIEKHFTLDNSMDGPDHRASLNPNELKDMVKGIRKIEKALGNGIKQPSKSEIKNIKIARKSIVASCEIQKGEKFSSKNITTKRPGNGISPMKWDYIIGKIAKRHFFKDDLIKF